ncbi:MAG TPA: PEP-CTERM sorting domain-containing protein [Bryobacteraceae bacterium]|nr:PEP-CTERM sorting domain-containing protein [Bryobacteraceae bacterium]
MNGRIFLTAVIAGALCILFTAAPSARADDLDSVTITLSPISGAAGSTVAVDATFTNSGPDTLNLDGDNLSVSDPLSVNDEFLANAPYTLDPGSVTFELFQVTIAPGTASGTYGTDGSDVFSFFGDFNGVTLEDDVPFTVDVTGAVAGPEPGTLWLLCAGLGIVAWLHRRRELKA